MGVPALLSGQTQACQEKLAEGFFSGHFSTSDVSQSHVLIGMTEST